MLSICFIYTGAKYIKDEGEEDKEPGGSANQMMNVNFNAAGPSMKDWQSIIHDTNTLEGTSFKLKVKSRKIRLHGAAAKQAAKPVCVCTCGRISK